MIYSAVIDWYAEEAFHDPELVVVEVADGDDPTEEAKIKFMMDSPEVDLDDFYVVMIFEGDLRDKVAGRHGS